MRRRILVDTSALFALVDSRDPHHALARETALQYRNAEHILLDLVWVETITLVKRALGPQMAIETGSKLLEGPPFVFYPVKGDDFWESWMIFQRFIDKEWSFVDCAILHMAQRLGVPEVFSFDRHFDQMSGLGIRRIPLRLR